MPLFWVLITLPILLILQRWIHRHLHGLALLLTSQQDRAVIIYAIILLPGVFLHEASHWLAATLLGVRTGSFSLIPQRQADGSVQLGYVEYYKGRTLDPVRESIIGGAPLIAGTAVILLIGLNIFNIPELMALVQTGHITNLTAALEQLYQTPDFFIWLYLLFAIGNGMMPSRSDRRAWPAFAITLAVLALLLYFLGLSDLAATELARPAALMFGYLGLAFSMAIGVDIFFMLVIAAVEGIVGRLKGVSVSYGAES
ncbi:MAG: hypothetical protein GY796_03880 [Chloroflexi bacterium]|nr:hypothetical protein [Chloroflexota bacterium]